MTYLVVLEYEMAQVGEIGEGGGVEMAEPVVAEVELLDEARSEERLVVDGERMRLDALDQVVGQVELEQAGHEAERVVVELADGVVRQVQRLDVLAVAQGASRHLAQLIVAQVEHLESTACATKATSRVGDTLSFKFTV